MNIAIRYYTQTGNTKKLAEAIATELGLEAIGLWVLVFHYGSLLTAFVLEAVHSPLPFFPWRRLFAGA